MNTSRKSEPNTCPGVVNASEVYTLEEASRRLRWRRRSLRQALGNGLRDIPRLLR